MSKKKKNTLKKDGNTFEIFQTTLIGSSLDRVLGVIRQRIEDGERTFITTPNPEFLVFAQKRPWFHQILIQSDIAIPDGIALFWAKEVLKKKGFFLRLFCGFWTGLKVIFKSWGQKRVTGTDLTEKLCQLAAKKNWTVCLLGAGPEVAQKALKNLQTKYQGLKGWADDDLKRGINQKQPDLLFVALGMGKQEKFIADNWPKLKVKLAMGVGGAFDYFSGEVKRAPLWVQKTGFEWLYRLLREPWRWKRQLALLTFIWLILRDKNDKI